LTALWRISGHDDLAGVGGEKADGRWHLAARGKRIVYLSEHPALALIEVLANLKGDPRLFPDRYRLMKIAAPDTVSRMTLESNTLPDSWRETLDTPRAAGDAWLSASASALLKVPSAPSPESWNYLLHPSHPDATRLQIMWSRWIRYDARLFHLETNM